MDDRDARDSETTRGVALRGEQRLLVIRGAEGDVVQLLGRDGRVTLSVVVTESGPVLRFEGASLVLQAAGALTIEADQLSLHGKSGLSLTSGGDLDVRAVGDLHSEGRAQSVTATLGDVKVTANDDVRLVGERIRMNC